MRVVRWEAMLLVDITFFPFLYLLSLPRLALHRRWHDRHHREAALLP